MNQETKDSLINAISLVSLIITIIRLIIAPDLESISLVLATLATVITLYVGKKKIEEVEKRYVVLPKQLFRISVALWGITGSGKTWLCNAFGRSLELYYNREIEGLVYRVEKTSYKNFSLLSREDLEPTRNVEDHSFKFERGRMSDKYSHAISSFQHYINIMDMPGTHSLEVSENFPFEQRAKKTHTLLTLIESDVVLIALDPTSVKGSPIVMADIPLYSRSYYAQMVSNLISILEEASEKKKYYAVCVTKADTIPSFYTYSPKALVAACFGQEMVKIINNFPDKNRLGVFSVSSVGFTNKLMKLTPNLNVEEGNLLDPDGWIPYGVEYPFFEAFEYAEKRYLDEKFNQKWITRITKNFRIKKYILYPKSHYELPTV